MNEIKPTYATSEQAKLLKEKKFDVKVKRFFDLISNTEIEDAPLGNYNLTKQSVSIPEQHQVVEWLRVTHGIHIKDNFEREYSFEKDKVVSTKYTCYVNKFIESITGYDFKFRTQLFNSPQEAYSAAFDYILKELI
jgi:hypothetical protein